MNVSQKSYCFVTFKQMRMLIWSNKILLNNDFICLLTKKDTHDIHGILSIQFNVIFDILAYLPSTNTCNN